MTLLYTPSVLSEIFDVQAKVLSTCWPGGASTHGPIGEPGGQRTGEPGGQGTRGPVGLSTCWPGGASTHESNGPC
ncbi:hypothetical protein Tco_0080870, partial [Tanacetum coccineum]